IQDRLAGGALVPQPFRYRAFLRLRTHDRRDQLVYQPVAHAFILHSLSVPRVALHASGGFIIATSLQSEFTASPGRCTTHGAVAKSQPRHSRRASIKQKDPPTCEW